MVQVYRNLHNGRWSVRSAKTGLVLAHADEIILIDAMFKVNEKGRQKVIEEQCKNVHAFCQGFVVEWVGDEYHNRHLYNRSHKINAEWTGIDTPVSYDPYRYGHFFNVKTLDSVNEVRYAYFTEDKTVLIKEL